MQEITILSSEEIMRTDAMVFVILACVFILSILGTGVYFLSKYNGMLLAVKILIYTMIITTISYFLVSFTIPKVPTGEYEVKVLIGDSVDFVEFTSQYEILDQEGLIYTVKSKK